MTTIRPRSRASNERPAGEARHRAPTWLAAGAIVLTLLATVPVAAQQKKSSLSDMSSPTAAAGTATPQNDTIKKTAQLINGMGYVVKSSGADFIVVEANSLVVALEPAGDGSALYASVYFQVPPDKLKSMPYEKILAYNGHSADYFGTSKGANDQMSIALMNHLSTAQLSPRTLKELIDQVTTDAQNHLDLLDAGNWKASVPDISSQ